MKSLIGFLILLLHTLGYSQINPKTKWGDVSQAEMDYKEVSFEKDANAVTLYETGNMLVAYRDWENKIYKRIKILSEKGKDQANIELIYYTYRNTENIRNLRAQTINFENGKKVITPVKLKDVYDAGLYGYYRVKKFAFPNVKVGSIIELEYDLINENHEYIEGWVFQHDIPTLYSSLSVNVQVPINYVPICVGEKLLAFNKHEKERNRNKHKSEWTLTDIPSLEKQDFMYNEKDYAERIDFQLRGYYHKTDGYVTEYSKWSDITKNILYFNESKSDDKLIHTISKLIQNNENEQTMIENIFRYFDKNYTWNNEISVSLKKNIADLSQSKKGNSSELNFLLNRLLKSKGIHSKLVLVSVREHRKLQTSYPYINQFTSQINYITLKDGSSFFVDATSLPEFHYQFFPLHNSNHYGLILDSEKEQFINVKPPISEFYTTQTYNFNSDGKLLFTKENKSNGYLRFELGSQIENSFILNALPLNFSEKNPTQFTNSHDKKYSMSRTQYENNSNIEQFLTFQNPISPIIHQYNFKEKNRKTPIEFDFPFYYKSTVNFKIPNEYKVEIPNDFNVKHEKGNKELIYFQNAEVKNGQLTYTVEFLINNTFFENQYTEIKSFFEKSNLDASKAILLKKN